MPLLGAQVPLTADLTDPSGVLEDATSLRWVVRDPAGMEHDETSSVTNPQTGVYKLIIVPDAVGVWYWNLVTSGNVAVAQGSFLVEDNYAVIGDPSAPTDLHVLVPRARRYCEGPYGAPEGRPLLSDDQIYNMVADAVGDLILYTGQQWRRTLIVTARDSRVGYPTTWATDGVLDEWESALITTQVALNYFFFVFRDLKMSQSYKTEGTEWEYALSVNVIRDYISTLKDARDLAIQGMMKHQPVLDQYVSNIRVRDQATIAVLEWWDYNSRGAIGAGIPGGQEASVIPWGPWGGP